MRRHLTTLLEVRSPDRKKLFFRYYDPRVLQVFLPTCDSAQLRQVFGPIDRFDMKAADSTQLVRFRTRPTPPSSGATLPETMLRTWTYPLGAPDDADDDRGGVTAPAAASASVTAPR